MSASAAPKAKRTGTESHFFELKQYFEEIRASGFDFSKALAIVYRADGKFHHHMCPETRACLSMVGETRASLEEIFTREQSHSCLLKTRVCTTTATSSTVEEFVSYLKRILDAPKLHEFNSSGTFTGLQVAFTQAVKNRVDLSTTTLLVKDWAVSLGAPETIRALIEHLEVVIAELVKRSPVAAKAHLLADLEMKTDSILSSTLKEISASNLAGLIISVCELDEVSETLWAGTIEFESLLNDQDPFLTRVFKSILDATGSRIGDRVILTPLMRQVTHSWRRYLEFTELNVIPTTTEFETAASLANSTKMSFADALKSAQALS